MAKYGDSKLAVFFETLLKHYGRQHWWPGETAFEVMVGAVLTQNTNWSNVEKAINNLKAAKLLSAEKINGLDHGQLAQIIRPAGYFNIKAQRLKNLVGWFCREYDGSIEALGQLSIDRLREQLLSIRGVGPETADSIILYALNKLTFVVDTYTCRVLVRHGCIDGQSDYEAVKDYCETVLPPDLYVYNEFHALIVRLGKERCKVRPRCQDCPLEQFEHCLVD